MRKEIEQFFSENKIEYFSAVRYRDCIETAPQIMERESFLAKSVIIFLIPYYTKKTENLSVYAASLDYHIFIKEITGRLIDTLKLYYPEEHFAAYGDHSPIDERHAALISGLGIMGDSGLLINEKYGTYVFIADVVTSIPPEELSAVKLDIKHCSHCHRCIDACPTGILSGKGSDCLSAITQRKGELTENEVELMRKCDTVWGCDICQEACPYNKEREVTPIDFFFEERIDRLTSEYLASLSKEELRRRAFGWRGRAVLERNLEKLGY